MGKRLLSVPIKQLDVTKRKMKNSTSSSASHNVIPFFLFREVAHNVNHIYYILANKTAITVRHPTYL
jgi:hypothetical protein